MKKFDMPVMEIAKFDVENVVTGSGGFESSSTAGNAKYRLQQNNVEWNNIMTFTF